MRSVIASAGAGPLIADDPTVPVLDARALEDAALQAEAARISRAHGTAETSVQGPPP